MAAQTTARKVDTQLSVGVLSLAVAAAAVCFGGGMAMLSGGVVRAARSGQGADDFLKMADAANSRVVGYFLGDANGGASDGDVVAQVQAGRSLLVANSAGAEAVTAAHVGRYCYVVDDQTVAGNSAGFTRPAAGIVVAVEAAGVLVQLGPDIAARAPAPVAVPFAINQTDLLAPTNADVVSPCKGTIARMITDVQAAVTTGGPITAKVGVTDVDGLSIAIADAAPKGTVQTDRPTAGHASTAVNPGDRIQIVPDAAFATAGAVNGVLLIER